jgi:hypothetical protein
MSAKRAQKAGLKGKRGTGARAKKPPSGKTVVGRGSPPKHKQFKKGESGNPRGRPKGSKNLATLIADAAYDKITVTAKSGETRKMSRIHAATMQLANKAAQGDPKAVLKFMDWVDEIETRATNSKPTETPISETDLKVLQAIHERMKLCELPQA